MDKKINYKLGFGCMRLPEGPDGKIDREHAQRMVDYAFENGINYFDTAWMYHNGESEVFIGEALKKYDRESYWLTSKMPMNMLTAKEQVAETFEKQLEKCGVEYFDNYLLHALNHNSWQKVLEWGVVDYIKEQKAKGRIKHIGFSYHDGAEYLEEIISYTDWECVQLQLNYYDMATGDAPELVRIANKYNVPIIIMEPIRGGFLARCVPDAIKKIEAAYGENKAASLALSYAFEIPGLMVALSGMSDMSHVIDNVKTVKDPIPMDDKAKKVIEGVLEDIKSFKTIPCTACRYCTPCTVGIEIPDVFSMYNDYKLFGNKMRFRRSYEELSVKPSECIECSNCESMCPQHLKIIDLLKEVVEAYENL